MRKTNQITRALAVATAAFVSAPGAVQAQGNMSRRQPESRVPGRRVIEAYLGGGISRVESNSNFGIGTVDFGGRRELFGASTPSWIDRGGFDIGVEVDLGRPGIILGPEGNTNIRFGVSYASGSERNSGNATVGVDGVQRIGLTFLEPDGVLGTGISSSFDGDGLYSTAKIDNDWTYVHLGWRETIPHPWHDEEDEAEFHLGGSIIYERFDQDFSGRADIVRGASSLAGQRTSGKTEDEYFGYEFNAGISGPLTEKFSVGIEAYITPAWHTGEAVISQSTDFGGDTIQRFRASDDDFEVTGGLRTHIKYEFSPTVSVKLSYEYSQLGGVSEVIVPANPDEQPAYFNSGSVERHFGRAELEWQLSDVRLKRDIVSLAPLDSGLGLYRYRYLWNDTLYVGVMAQEVAAHMPDAVMRGDDGFLRVNYARLGLSMQTWDEWVAARQKPAHSAAIEMGAMH